MKANHTYVAPGYKYGLLHDPNYYNNCDDVRIALINWFKKNATNVKDEEHQLEREMIELEAEVALKCIIPYENVDGLTVRELEKYDSLRYEKYDSLRNKNEYLIFVMYDSLNNSEWDIKALDIDKFKAIHSHGIIRFMYLIDIEKYKDYKIDEVIEEHLIENLNKFNLQNRRRALSFLEKYIYDDALDVDHIIERYLHANSDPNSNRIMDERDYINIPDRLLIEKIEEKEQEQKRKKYNIS